MKIRVDNLFEHAEGGYYCLLSGDTALKEPSAVGVWLDAVIYTGIDTMMRSTTKERWLNRFTQVAEYTGDDEGVLQMIRRTNPGNTDFDFVSVMESWHESEINITGHMLELAVAAVLMKYEWPGELEGDVPERLDPDGDCEGVEVTILTSDLHHVLQNFEITRTPVPHGFRFSMRKPFPD